MRIMNVTRPGRRCAKLSVSAIGPATPAAQLRTALYGGVALSVVAFAVAGDALASPDACNFPMPAVASCSGDQSAGVEVSVDFTSPPVTDLTVFNLTGDITPAAGFDGVLYTYTGGGVGNDISIVVDTDDFQILTQADGANGADGVRVFGDGHGDVFVSVTSDIVASGQSSRGVVVDVQSSGPVFVVVDGPITTSGDFSEGVLVSSTMNIGDVDVDIIGDISTNGFFSHGVFVEDDQDGSVDVQFTGSIVTSGALSTALAAEESGAGDASIVSQGNITTNTDFSGGIEVDERDAGSASLFNDGNVTTNGMSAYGLRVSERGVGDAGVFSTGDISTNSIAAIFVSETDDGSILVDSQGAITTTGEDASGVQLEEFGLGAAVMNSIGAVTTSGNDSRGLELEEEDAGTAQITNGGDIVTNGVSAEGIYLIEGGDGDAIVLSEGDISTNGSRGIFVFENNAGGVSITSTGAITTTGQDASGIWARGQMSGHVIVSSEGAITTAGDTARGVTLTKTGVGQLEFTNAGDITTNGANASGVFMVESGDGDVTATSTGNITTAGAAARGVTIEESATGNAILNSIGNITTNGVDAEAIYINEIDLGGVGGFSRGDISTNGSYGVYLSEAGAGSIGFDSIGNITTQGDLAGGIRVFENGDGTAQITSEGVVSTSGADASALQVTEGGAGGVLAIASGRLETLGDTSYGIRLSESDGGDATALVTADIMTGGDQSTGIYAAELGDGSISVVSAGDIATFGANSSGIFVVESGAGDAVLTHQGDIDVNGVSSYGLYLFEASLGDAALSAQGDVVSMSNFTAVQAMSAGGGNLDVDFEGDISSSGGAFAAIHESVGNVMVNIDGDISTTGGAAAHGVHVSKTSGGGNIDVNVNGDISTQGANAAGIDVSSVDGNISIVHTGDVVASGADAHGVSVEGPAAIAVALSGGDIQGGSGAGAGVMALSEASTTTTINNSADVSALSGLAISGGAGDDTLNNSGTITGDVLLGGGVNSFNNMTAGVFNSSASIAVGAGALLANGGRLNPGGPGVVQTTTLDGDYEQAADGVYAVDVGVGGDRFEIGGAAVLAGAVEASLNGVAAVSQEFTILNAAGGVTDNGLSLELAGVLEDLFLVDVALVLPNASDVVLAVDFDIPTDGLNPNQTNIANHVLDSGVVGGGMQPVLTGLAFGVSSVANLRTAMDQLSPEIYLNMEKATVFAAGAFADSLFNCGRSGSDRAAFSDRRCVWLHVEARSLEEDATARNIGFDENVAVVSSGVQYALTPKLMFGVGVNYEGGSLDAGADAEADVSRIAGGVSTQYRTGPLLLSAAATAGSSRHEDVRRSIAFGGFNGVASGEQSIFFTGVELNAAYLLHRGRYYLRPAAEASYLRIDTDDVAETGAGAANLNVEGKTDGVFSISSTLEFGADFEFPSGRALRPYVKPGISYLTGHDPILNAAFSVNAPGIDSFWIRNNLEDVYADVEAGAVLFGVSGVSARLNYIGRFAKGTAQQGVAFRASYQF